MVKSIRRSRSEPSTGQLKAHYERWSEVKVVVKLSWCKAADCHGRMLIVAVLLGVLLWSSLAAAYTIYGLDWHDH